MIQDQQGAQGSVPGTPPGLFALPPVPGGDVGQAQGSFGAAEETEADGTLDVIFAKFVWARASFGKRFGGSSYSAPPVRDHGSGWRSSR